MTQKSITSAQADVRKSMEQLFVSCRNGKIGEVPKLHKKFIKSKKVLDEIINDKETAKHGKEK